MRDGEPSPSAILAAAARAYTSHEFDPSIRNPDWLADPFLSPDELALLDGHPMGRAVNQDYRIAALDPEVMGLARPVLISTRFIDQHLDQALGDGFTQFVILNAGLDSRAYRFRTRFENKRVIEVDDAATQELKLRRVRAVLGPPPPFVSYASRIPALNGRTLFIWEGASMRSSEAEVRRVLMAVAAIPGSRVVVDYVPRGQVERVTKDPASPPARWEAASWGEPWVFGVPGESFFEDLGFEVRDSLDTNSAEAARRFLTRRDGTVFGPARNGPGGGFEGDLGRVLVELWVR